MDIENLGDVVAEGLVNNNLISDISDIYILTKKDLLLLPLFASKKANNLLEAIENSKSRDFNKLIYALGIPNIGKNGAKLLANRYKNMDNLIKASINELLEITDVGEITANSVVEFFSNEENLDIVDRLKGYGVNMEIKNKEEKKVGKAFEGMAICITGSLSKKRDEYIKIIEDNGGSFINSISRKTDFLLIGEHVGFVKINKAKECGTKVITEDEFNQMLGV